MIVCFNCSAETKAQLDSLVATGDYADHGEAIAAAIQNLTVIHSAMKDEASLVLTADALRNVPSTTASIESVASKSAAEPAQRAKPQMGAAVPLLFQLRQEITPPEKFSNVSAERKSSARAAPIDEWMFGQFNRMLPAKVTCRALANLIASGEDRQPLHVLAKSIANEAAKLGQHLTALDEKRHLGRDDAIAVAFPSHPSEFKSIQRFANQFVASANKEGELSGLPVSLQLVGRHPSDREGIFLTKAGWEFSMLKNPLLDGISASTTRKFSDDEISFLLDHICASVPVEASAYTTILTEVTRGVLTPDDLDAALSKLPGHPKKTLPQYVSTQRSGVICRMADLDLIGRSRTGTRVSYVLTPRGKDFLRSVKPDGAQAVKTGRA